MHFKGVDSVASGAGSIDIFTIRINDSDVSLRVTSLQRITVSLSNFLNILFVRPGIKLHAQLGAPDLDNRNLDKYYHITPEYTGMLKNKYF